MVEVNNKTRNKIDLVLVKKTTEKFLRYYKVFDKDVSIAIVGDATMRKFNKEYRGKDSATDVLSFCDREDNFLGEIIIDYAQIKRQAPKYSESIQKELIFILVHGLLHLIGYEDDTEKGRMEMEALGKEFIKLII